MVKLFSGESKVVLVIEYNGQCYHGFQWQANVPTIQSELETVIMKLTGEKRRVVAASRTDAGVHAKGQVVSFWTKSTLATRTLAEAFNYYLPSDIVVKEAYRVAENFNVRRDVVSREYEYRILNRRVRSPFATGLAYFVPNPLNLPAMNEACRLLEGEHNFISFTNFLGRMTNPLRTVYEAKIKKRGDVVIFHIKANSFLPHQVRNTVGLLIRIGLGKMGVSDFWQIMEAQKLGLAGPAAPAYGLYLTKINYPEPLNNLGNEDL